jgi:hypothetical protein
MGRRGSGMAASLRPSLDRRSTEDSDGGISGPLALERPGDVANMSPARP